MNDDELDEISVEGIQKYLWKRVAQHDPATGNVKILFEYVEPQYCRICDPDRNTFWSYTTVIENTNAHMKIDKLRDLEKRIAKISSLFTKNIPKRSANSPFERRRIVFSFSVQGDRLCDDEFRHSHERTVRHASANVVEQAETSEQRLNGGITQSSSTRIFFSGFSRRLRRSTAPSRSCTGRKSSSALGWSSKREKIRSSLD